ncbi:MAG: 2Fe-2S iron-sulfur cluster-binding protein [Anaerolineales bacterium]
MSNDVTLTIDGQSVTVPTGTTILKAAEGLGANVPTICYHDHTSSYGLCRMCVVEVEGARVLAASCVAQVDEGMVVYTRNERVERSRRTILELLDSAVNLAEAPEIQAQFADYNADPGRFPDGARRSPAIIDDNPMFVRDYGQCVLCWRCVQVCAEDAQFTYAINFSGRGFNTSVDTFFHQGLTDSTCVFCGQCVGVCPTGALKPKREWLLEQGHTPEEIMQMTRTQRRKKMRRQERPYQTGQ